MTETKNEALELAELFEIEDGADSLYRRAAAILRAQAADIERLTKDRDHLAANNEMRAQVILALSSDNTDFANERDQLKAVIEQLNQSNTSRLMQILVDDKVVLQERVGQLKAKNQKLVDASTFALELLDFIRKGCESGAVKSKPFITPCPDARSLELMSIHGECVKAIKALKEST